MEPDPRLDRGSKNKATSKSSAAKGSRAPRVFYGHTENVIVVGDNDTLTGDGRLFWVWEIPHVHWPIPWLPLILRPNAIFL